MTNSLKDPFTITIQTTREKGLILALKLREIGIEEFDINEVRTIGQPNNALLAALIMEAIIKSFTMSELKTVSKKTIKKISKETCRILKVSK